MPPAATTEFAPALIERIALTIASSPDAQTLLTVSAVTVLASPDLKSTCRAGFWPTPACRTSPNVTCSISEGSIFDRSIAPVSATAPSVVAESGASAPPSLPKGVLAMPMTTALEFMSVIMLQFYQARRTPREGRYTMPQRGLRRERHSQDVIILLNRWRERGVAGAPQDVARRATRGGMVYRRD